MNKKKKKTIDFSDLDFENVELRNTNYSNILIDGLFSKNGKRLLNEK